MPGVTPYRAVRRARPWLERGARVLVIGCGALGQFALQYLRHGRGGRDLHIVVRELDPAKLEIAAELGADVGLLEGDDQMTHEALGGSADVVLDMVGTDDTLAHAAAAVAPDGLVVLVGEAGGQVPFGMDVPGLESWFTTVAWGTRSDLRDVVRLASRGRLHWNVDPMPLAAVQRGPRPASRGDGDGQDRARARLTRLRASAAEDAPQDPALSAGTDVERRRGRVVHVAQGRGTNVGHRNGLARPEVLGGHRVETVAHRVEVAEDRVGTHLDARGPRVTGAQEPGSLDLWKIAERAAGSRGRAPRGRGRAPRAGASRRAGGVHEGHRVGSDRCRPQGTPARRPPPRPPDGAPGSTTTRSWAASARSNRRRDGMRTWSLPGGPRSRSSSTS